jgi:mycothiol synthase
MVEVRALRPGAPGIPDEAALARHLAELSERRDGHPALGDAVWRDLESPAPGSAGFAAFADGEPVGYLRAMARPGTPIAFECAMTVHPDFRDGAAPGALLDQGIAHARAHHAAHVSVWIFGADIHSDALAAGRGLTAERELWQMRVPLPIGERAVWPAGVTVRPFCPGVDDGEWLDVNNRAFAADPDQGNWSHETLAGRLAEPWFDPEGFLIADDGGRIAGFCWTKVHPAAPPHEPHALGEIYVIGVDPADRGRGLGRALVVGGLDSLRQRGIEVGMLFVDAANDSAVRLYRALGFVTTRVDRSYGRALSDAGSSASSSVRAAT